MKESISDKKSGTENILPENTAISNRKMPVEKNSPMSLRRGVQFLFLAICIFIGIRFYLFINQLVLGMPVSVQRPPGVEAFLPISALLSLKYFLLTGIVNSIHPAGLIIFMAICATAIMFKKVFCGWVCPFGLFADYLEKIHLYIFGRRLRVPLWLDVILRGIKYLVAGFFIWSVFVKMPTAAIEQFIRSSYNIFADVKMLEFFTHMSVTALLVIMSLIILSIIIDRFWCRYLCPYGALLGVLGLFSLGKITRNEENCIRCGQCEKVCPGMIAIMEKKKINSCECLTCLKCLDVCPVDNAMDMHVFFGKIPMNKIKVALVLVVFFSLCFIGAKFSGNWQNDVPVAAYRHYVLKNSSYPVRRGK